MSSTTSEIAENYQQTEIISQNKVCMALGVRSQFSEPTWRAMRAWAEE